MHDRGRQYRSAIFYQSPEQREFAAAYIKQLSDAHVFGSPIVTTLEPLEEFFEAEPYHQNYATRNPGQPYILFTTLPKMEKLRETFGDLAQLIRRSRISSGGNSQALDVPARRCLTTATRR